MLTTLRILTRDVGLNVRRLGGGGRVAKLISLSRLYPVGLYPVWALQEGSRENFSI